MFNFAFYSCCEVKHLGWWSTCSLWMLVWGGTVFRWEGSIIYYVGQIMYSTLLTTHGSLRHWFWGVLFCLKNFFIFCILNGLLVSSLFYFCSTQQVGENTTSGTLISKKNYDEKNIKIIVTTYGIFNEN